jgi:acetolactate synthase-1/2/3 large subunit
LKQEAVSLVDRRLFLERTGAEMLVEALRDYEVPLVFSYPGGSNLPIVDALAHAADIGIVQNQNEQASVHTASGFARSGTTVGVVLATSGPGALNTLTGIGTAWGDGTPLLIITGQVKSGLIGTKAFQECPIADVAAPIAKACFQPRSADELAVMLHQAFAAAKAAPSGPVVLDIPVDIQTQKGVYIPRQAFEKPSALTAVTVSAPENDARWTNPATLIEAAKRPVLLIGGGVAHEGAVAAEALRRFAQAADIPVAATLMGVGCYPARDRHLWLGLAGMHGTAEANMALQEADLILAVGARFSDRTTGDPTRFAPDAKIIQIDRASHLGRADIVIDAEVGPALDGLRQSLAQPPARKAWWTRLERWRGWESTGFETDSPLIKPQQALRLLSDLTAAQSPWVTTCVGQHQIWTALNFAFDRVGQFVCSGGMGTMGYGLPAAIGVQLRHPDDLVLHIGGDGSFFMGTEMKTVADLDLPIKSIVLDNGTLGMVRQQQEVSYGQRYAQVDRRSRAKMTALAEAYGWTSFFCNHPADLESRLAAFLKTEGPAFFHCIVDPSENCLPMVPAGRALHEMILPPHAEARRRQEGTLVFD